MDTLRLMLRKEWSLLLSYGSLIAILLASEQLFGNLDTGTRIGVMFGWLFVVILLSAFSVVHHAESLAQKLGEPYGTLILTISVIGLEAIRMVEQGVASAEDIDRAMTLGYGFPMGPLRLTDLVGLDVRLHIADYLSEHLPDGAHFAPPPLLRAMVADGKLGKKSGQGFYAWES